MRYERIRSLGRGATAETFLCKDLHRGGRLIARKVFLPEWASERPDLIDREFHTLSALAHPFIAAVEDFGEDPDEGRLYLASEFIEGKNFLEAVRGLDVNQIVWLFLQVLEALDYLYFRNVVHLDLKPENLLVRESPARGREVALIDFGLAALGGRMEAVDAIGTPPFTAPEFSLRRGIDTRSDLYSAGVLLYAALCKRLPFEADGPVALLNLQLRKDPEPPIAVVPGMAPALSDFILKLLDRDPKKRFESPRIALEALKALMGGPAPWARRVPPPLFEDPGLLFHERPARGLLEKVLTGEGRWAVPGGEGSGKSFLARWLERELCARHRKVLRLHGARLVLETQETIPDGTVILVDDAEEGPTSAWLESISPDATVVLFGKNLSSLAVGPENEKIVGIGNLDQASVGRIVKTTLPENGASLVKDWWEHSGGNPREMIRYGHSLVRRGALAWDGRSWKAVPGAASGELTDTTAVLRSFLQNSGVSLDAETLAVWTGWSVAEVEEAVAESLRAGSIERFFLGGRILYRSAGGEISPDAAPPPADARAFFQKLHDEGRYEEGLAVFDRFFGEVSDDGLILAKARLSAGAGRHEKVRALLTPEFLDRLDVKEKASAYETLGKSALFAGRSPEDREMLSHAVALAAFEKDPDVLSRALLHLGILAQRQGDSTAAKTFYEHALAAAREAPAKDLLTGAVLLNLANLHFDAAQWDAAETRYRECLECLRRTSHDAVTAQATLNLANLSFYQGKTLRAEGLAREALRLAVPHRYLLTQGRALLLLSMVDGERGRKNRQGERLSEALFVLEQAGQTFERIVAIIHRAYFYEAAGRLDAAEADARLGQELARRSQASDLEKQAGLILGKVLAHAPKNDEEAWGVLEGACRHFSHGKNLQMIWECEFECGEFLKARGCPTEARACYERALEAVDDLVLRLSEDAREAFLRDRKREKIKERLA